MSSPQEWYAAVPPVTRAWLTGAVLAGFGGRFGLLDPRLFGFDAVQVFQKFQIWRLPLNFAVFGKLGFNWVVQMVMLYRYSSALEGNPYPARGGSGRGNIADYVYMLCFGAAVLLSVAWFQSIKFMATSLAFMVIYVWSKRHPSDTVTLYFFKFEGKYLPFALIAWSIAMGEDPVMDLLGLVAGHLFYFLVDVLPNTPGAFAGRRLLGAPQWLYKLFGETPTYVDMAAASRAQRAGAPGAVGGGAGGARHVWGEGRALVG